MSDDGDGETSPAEFALLIALFGFGALFVIKPTMMTIGDFADFLDAFPEPSALGPYGHILAAFSMALGGTGMLGKGIRNFRQ